MPNIFVGFGIWLFGFAWEQVSYWFGWYLQSIVGYSSHIDACERVAIGHCPSKVSVYWQIFDISSSSVSPFVGFENALFGNNHKSMH